MANTSQVIDMVAKTALAIAHEKATFLGTINRTYDDSFARTGAKIGDTLRIRLPNEFTRRKGSRVMDVQDVTEPTTSITVATQDGVDMRFNSAELTLAAASKEAFDEFTKRYLEPAMSVLVSGIESDVLQGVTKLVANRVGTAGTVIGATGDISAIGTARAYLNQSLAPKDRRCIQMDSITMATIANGVKSLFHDAGQIKGAFLEGFIGRTQMADIYENERTWAMTNGTDVTCTLDTYTVINGDADLTVTNFATPTAGMSFTVDGMFDVHPETKDSLGRLKQFTVLAGSTNTNLLISPTIYLTGPRQNVTAAPATTATVNWYGALSTAYRQNLMYHPDAFAFVTADLPLMDGADKCVRKMMDGLSIRVWTDGDIRNDELLCRLDILYGYAAIRPTWACRLSN